jgi:tripartite-type tricarboxylate transporter receptor subunit TctC
MAPLARLDAFKGFDVMQWFGLMAPRGTPQPVIDRMAKELDEVMKSPQVAQQLTSQGLTPAVQGPAEFGDFIAKEREKYGRVVREAKITAS